MTVASASAAIDPTRPVIESGVAGRQLVLSSPRKRGPRRQLDPRLRGDDSENRGLFATDAANSRRVLSGLSTAFDSSAPMLAALPNGRIFRANIPSKRPIRCSGWKADIGAVVAGQHHTGENLANRPPHALVKHFEACIAEGADDV